MMTDCRPLRFHLAGPFRVETRDQMPCTPVAAKAQGLLLLLLLSPHGERTRRWLQDMLWSDRAPEQGAGSLRQALRQIRAALAPHSDVIRADRQRVSLDLSRIEVVAQGAAELAEGLDVRDPEFEEWLRLERASRADVPAEPAALVRAISSISRLAEPDTRRIRVRATPSAELSVHWLVQLVADGMARLLRERLSHEILRSDTPAAEGELSISVGGYWEPDSGLGVRITLDSGAEGQQSWSGFRFVEQRGAPPVDDPRVQQLMVEAAAAVDTAIRARFGSGDAGAMDQDPDLLCRSAIRAMFSMSPEQLLLADEMLRRAAAIKPHSAYDAWRAQVRIIQSVERHPGDRDQFKLEGERFARLAAEADPENALVIAILANVNHFLLGDSAASLELAERAVRLNPGSPMALWSRSTARLYTGATKTAHQDALKGRFLTEASEFRFFWDLQEFATSMLLGKVDDALRLAERVSVQCPEFRPPHRYLTALHAHFGDEDRAVAQAEGLRRLEHDFSIDRLMNDHTYPASLIRRAPNLDTRRLANLL